ncbi:phosphotransferase family protein [Catenuloplanes japonicus]|uniref:phosphotransferase n=1 Tax=Catenuloplanes japonicus TaxID=33876 RepID=UPI000527563B|nr:phosphotransferase [Catenuloplanes japonicus]
MDNDWHDPDWRASAHEWITAHLDAPATGPIEQMRARPWSVTHRVPTGAGFRWFKANITDCRYEAVLAERLGRGRPERVLSPLAISAAHGWMLTPDAGPTLRDEVAASDRDGTLARWCTMLREYAALQREVTPIADELVALGVPDHRPSVLPEQLASLLDDPAVRADLGPARLERVSGVVPAFAEWCAELAASGIPASVQHDDLTDANVFAGPPHRFFDWGDAGVAHPFGSLLVALSFAGYALDLRPGAPEFARLRDAYLSEWPGDRAVLRRSVSLACRVTRVSRAMSWRRALRGAALPVKDDFRTSVADWLAELPAPDPI